MSVKLSEYYSKLPHIKADGSNWPLVKERFIFATSAAGLADHLDDDILGLGKYKAPGTKPPAPVDPDKPTNDEVKAHQDYKKILREWETLQSVLKQGMASIVPDALFLRIKDEDTALDMWNAVQDEYQKKSRMVTVDLRRRLQDERCREGQDVKEHLNKLQSYREDLSAMDADLDDDDFVTIVLGSLPASWENYLTALTTTTTTMGTDLTPEVMMQGISGEADRRAIRAKG
ncbi:hypothetical protein CYLTODRAFT_363285, partial [Cylindrobasidium torrendii FP15055 ss-10]